MMKNETLLRKQRTATFSLAALFNAFTLFLASQRLFVAAARLYSFLLGRPVHAVKAVQIFYAQFAALAVLLPVAYGPGWRMCFLILFLLAARSAMEGLNLPDDEA